MPKVGDTLPITVQLHDGDTTKFCLAILRDDTQAALPASPVTLSHTGNGRYDDDSVVMPSGTNFVGATYEVYDDAGFTTLSEDHTVATDMFELVFLDADLTVCLEEIKDKLDDILSGSGISVTAIGAIQGVVKDLDVLLGNVRDDDTVGTIIDDGSVQGDVSSTDQVAGVISSDKISGTVED